MPSESRHQELKNRMRSINQGLDRLRRVSQQGYGADGQAGEPPVAALPPPAPSPFGVCTEPAPP